MDTHDKIRAFIEKQAQDIFNVYARPLLVKQMKRFKVSKISYSMGVYFYIKNGECYSDDELIEKYPRCQELVTDVLGWQTGVFYSLINADIDLTKPNTR